MKYRYAIIPAILLLAAGCRTNIVEVYEDEPYIPTIALEVEGDIPSTLYLSDTLKFKATVTSRYACLHSIEMSLKVGDEVLAGKTLTLPSNTKSQSFDPSFSIPFIPDMTTGKAVFSIKVTNVNGGNRSFSYDIDIVRPEFEYLTLVLKNGSVKMMPTADPYTYHAEGDFDVTDKSAFVMTPSFGARGSKAVFKMNQLGGIRMAPAGTEGFPMAKTSAGKSVVTFNTRTFSYALPDQVYLYSVVANVSDGTPPADSPFCDIVLSRNKKALDSRNRSGNRITDDNGTIINFTILPNSQCLDGFSGNVRGVITANAVKVNIGSKKIIAGNRCFFGFSFPTTAGQMSGWIREDRINDPVHMAIGSHSYNDFMIDLTPAVVGGDCPDTYKVFAADPKPWADLKVRSGIKKNENVAVTDYVDRGDGTVYLLYALPFFGGYANDAVIGHGEPEFIPDAGVPAMILPVFLPSDADDNDRAAYAKPEHKQIRWVFGRIGTSRGWSPDLNLQLKK